MRQEPIPQATLHVPFARFAARFAELVIEDYDDLDHYEAVALSLDEQPFALMHYRHDTEGQTKIHLPIAIRDLGRITALVEQIVLALDLPASAVAWQRADGLVAA